ncbi:hypothetical protein PAXRUDRAFT_836311 [Paxillus rubicundulus Ve08.2h10]|uniref:Uncharacterized protein n=1 Tax=Paxillus rubicundulus Ve08.2h10 TaxID=930991 RepID=A0A0D0D7Z8_9AGAM|nr:hypothetical protein PAXRUDRAFT_836311 [Paxillus rubicundulus Ve08.2h10]
MNGSTVLVVFASTQKVCNYRLVPRPHCHFGCSALLLGAFMHGVVTTTYTSKGSTANIHI